MADNKVTLELEVTGNAEVRINGITSAVKEFSEEGSKGLGKFQGAFNSFAGNLAATAVTKAFSLMGDAAAFAFDQIKQGVDGAIETEDAINQLNQALIATGQYSESTSEELVAFAQGLQQTTKFSDDAVLSAQSLIQNIGRLEKDALKTATKAALDMSAALGIDLETAARMVGKAAAGEVGSFKKLGISIREGQDNAETFSNAMAVLNQRFGGAAANQVQTFSGAVALLKNAWADTQKEIGLAVIKNQSLINVFSEVSKFVNGLTDSLASGKDGMAQFISNVIVVGIQIAKVTTAIIDFINRGISALVNTITSVVMDTLGALTGVLGLVSDQWKSTSKAFFDGAQLANKGIKDAFYGESGLDKLEGLLANMQKGAEAGFGQTASHAARAGAAIKGTVGSIVELTEAQRKLGEQGKQIAEDAVKKDPAEEFNIKQAALEEALNQNLISYTEFYGALQALIEDRDTKEAEASGKRLSQLQTDIQNMRAIDETFYADRIAQNQATIDAILAQETNLSSAAIELKRRQVDQEKRINATRMSAISDSLNQLASLQNAKTAEIAAVGKAAAIAQTTIQTYQGATAAAAALAPIPFVGPVLAAGAAAAFIAAGLANVARISGVPLKTGITEVPGGYPNDTFPARLTSGERVVDANTNQDLKSFLGGGGGNAMVPLLSAILDRLDHLENHVTVHVGNKTIIDEVREGMRSGRTLSYA